MVCILHSSWSSRVRSVSARLAQSDNVLPHCIMRSSSFFNDLDPNHRSICLFTQVFADSFFAVSISFCWSSSIVSFRSALLSWREEARPQSTRAITIVIRTFYFIRWSNVSESFRFLRSRERKIRFSFLSEAAVRMTPATTTIETAAIVVTRTQDNILIINSRDRN